MGRPAATQATGTCSSRSRGTRAADRRQTRKMRGGRSMPSVRKLEGGSEAGRAASNGKIARRGGVTSALAATVPVMHKGHAPHGPATWTLLIGTCPACGQGVFRAATLAFDARAVTRVSSGCTAGSPCVAVMGIAVPDDNGAAPASRMGRLRISRTTKRTGRQRSIGVRVSKGANAF
jgi:hypothetical protein